MRKDVLCVLINDGQTDNMAKGTKQQISTVHSDLVKWITGSLNADSGDYCGLQVEILLTCFQL